VILFIWILELLILTCDAYEDADEGLSLRINGYLQETLRAVKVHFVIFDGLIRFCHFVDFSQKDLLDGQGLLRNCDKEN
jgi:hypothetical protein